MPHTVQAVVPPRLTAGLVRELSEIGLLSMRLQPGVSVEPAGDVLSLEVTDRKLAQVVAVLGRAGLGEDPGLSMTTASPASVVSAGSGRSVNRECAPQPDNFRRQTV